MTVDIEQRLHRALANPLRRRLLGSLRARGRECDVEELAATLGVHSNTVRGHLVALEDVGLVTSAPEPRDRPGRPRLLYRATDRATEVEADGPGYRFLAEVLARHVASASDDPAVVCVEVGTTWGRHLVQRPTPVEQLGAAEGVERLVVMLDDLGFAPEVEPRDDGPPHIALRRCPFLDVAREHQQVVCAIHLGLMRGALDELGVAVEATALHPFVTPDRCVTDLAAPV